MCDTMFTKSKQELDAINNAKTVIAKVLSTYAIASAGGQKTSSANHDDTPGNKLEALIDKCSIQVTNEVIDGHIPYEQAINTMSAVGMILSGRGKEFSIPKEVSYRNLNQSTTVDVMDTTVDPSEE